MTDFVQITFENVYLMSIYSSPNTFEVGTRFKKIATNLHAWKNKIRIILMLHLFFNALVYGIILSKNACKCVLTV
jgi:hypothetical protein